MRLWIAEKPSLAQTIAKSLRQTGKGDGYIETQGGIVTWCFGHLFEQASPEDYDERYKTWKLDNLPILPAQWKLKPRSDAKKQINVIKALLKTAKDVVNAGDPDREGQLLVDEVLEELGYKGKVLRVWLQDLTESGVAKAISKLEDNQKYRGLKEAAETRGRADWLVGMNLTRVYTLKAKSTGYTGVLSVGRVQTPTLALVVARDREIENFKPTPYFAVNARFKAVSGAYLGSWVVPEAIADAAGRCLDKSIASAVATKIQGKSGHVVEYEKVGRKESPPLPFSLSKLQATASARWGMSAQKVLDTAQSLYETHKITTYPRSDCEYLESAKHGEAPHVLTAISKASQDYANLVKGANPSIKSKAFDDKKISAHTGIIPTAKTADLAALSKDEARIYDIIVRHYLAQFYPDHEYLATKILTECEGERFRTSGRTPTKDGWKSLFRATEEEPEKRTKREDDDEESSSLPPLTKNEPVKCEDGTVASKETKPPARFTEGTLIEAMAGVSKYVSDPTIKAKLKETSGIGTEATRAGIIETLKKRIFLTTKGKQLISTTSARDFIDALNPDLTNPGTTALWEQVLDGISSGKVPQKAFMDAQIDWLKKQVDAARGASIAVASTAKTGSEHKCPRCGQGVLRKIKGAKGTFWGCSRYQDGCKVTFNDSRGKPDLSRPSK